MSFWLVNLVQRNEAQKQIHGVSYGKRQVMVTGEGSELDICDYKGLIRELFAEIKSIANTRLLSSNRQSEETIINEELTPLELSRLPNENLALKQMLSDLENSYESLKPGMRDQSLMKIKVW